ncbi:S-adenosyl-L-methionine-dependent methyltransferase [Xylaria cf. heliscus]|nr:S-adenosyl-L-methionine-dependent methyltransferase [Xylaria cf. heliscus]
MEDSSTLLHLAQTISQLSKQLHDGLGPASHLGLAESNDLPDGSDNAGLKTIRSSLNDVIQDLQLLVNGPKAILRSLYGSHYDLAAHQVALEFKFFEKVPLDGTISIDALASSTRLSPDVVGRVLRLLATQRVFHEIRKNEFAHTPLSATIAKEEDLEASFHMQMDEVFQAASETAKYLRQSPSKLDGAHCPFSMRFQMPIFEYYKQNPEKGERFGKALAGATQLDRDVDALCNQYDWQSVQNGTVVDVGGSDGSVSLILAKKWPHLSFIVQDASPTLLSQGRTQLPIEYESRFTFQEHDFFTPQIATNAHVFFIRQCLHNWTDEDCVKILRCFVPALEKCKDGTPLLINESVLPELGSMSRAQERLVRHVDISMLINVGGRQRSADDFRKMCKDADKRLEIVKVYCTGSMGLLEVQLIK